MPKNKRTKNATRELGYQVDMGVTSWGGFIMDEHEANPALMWPLSIDVYDRMHREDSQVGSVLRAVMLPIRSARWVLDPTGCDTEIVDHVADDFGIPVKGRSDEEQDRTGKDRFSWDDHLRLALLMLVYGHSIFEQVYSIDEFTELAHLRKLAWRPPRTIEEFEVARDGGLVSIKQYDVKKPIPVSHLVAYVNERQGGNWVGQSLLRTAYKNGLLKDRMLRAQALAVERNGLGVPKYVSPPVPDGVKAADRKAWVKEQIEHGLEIAKGFRAGETAGVSLPHGAEFSLVAVTGKLPETDKPIRYHDEQIARAVLAHFLNLGTETGSWALGSTFADFFTNSLNAVARQIADVTNRHVIEDLVERNWGQGVRAPRLVCEPIGAQHAATAESIRALVECGVITPDDALEDHTRDLHGLPVRDDKTARAPVGAPDEEGTADGQADGQKLVQHQGRRWGFWRRR